MRNEGMAASGPLLTRKEVASLLGVSTRTVDRMRDVGADLGEVTLPGGQPRFDAAVIREAIGSGVFKMKTGRPKRKPDPPPAEHREKPEPKSPPPPSEQHPSLQIAV